MYQPPRKPDHTAARLVEGDRFLAETATLSAELEGRVPADLVADLVRAVLDESQACVGACAGAGPQPS